RARPDVALLDIEMPGLDGLAAAAALRAQLPECRVVMLTTFGRPGYLRQALESGAGGVLLKDAAGNQPAPPLPGRPAGGRGVGAELALAALSAGDNPLTERERQVLAAAHRGAGIGEIAERLSLSEGTVRNYLSEAIQKLGAHNRVEAAHIAQERGWL